MVKVCTVSIALGMVVMILAIAVVTGFRGEIERKIVGFGGHLQIANYDSNDSYESTPISKNQVFIPELAQLKGVKNIQQYIYKGGIISTENDNQGVMLKGVGADFDWSFFASSITEGSIPSYSDSVTSNDIAISNKLCRLLRLKLNDRFEVYFVENPIRVRRFTIKAIFDTQLQDIDETLVICDMRHLQRINGWSEDQIAGFEVNLTSMSLLDKFDEEVAELVSYKLNDDGSMLKVSSIKQRYAHLFSWLDVLDTNVWIILSLTLIVAGFNMISGLLIILLEKASMIGLLKALGMRAWAIQKLFIFRAAFIVLKGILIGNLLGIGLGLLQKYVVRIPLNPESYFIDTIPINLEWQHILLLNVGAFVLIVAALTIPSLIIAKITPEKSIRFD